MVEFSRSGVGRWTALSVGIALVGGGASALMTQGPEATFLMALSLFLPTVITVVALPSALEEHWAHALALGLLLPTSLLLYAIGLGVGRTFFPYWGYGFMTLGVVPLLVAARPSRDALPASPSGAALAR